MHFCDWVLLSPEDPERWAKEFDSRIQVLLQVRNGRDLAQARYPTSESGWIMRSLKKKGGSRTLSSPPLLQLKLKKKFVKTFAYACSVLACLIFVEVALSDRLFAQTDSLPVSRVKVAQDRPGIKKMFEIYLRERAPTAEIEDYAAKLRAENPGYENFFVRYWLEGVDFGSAWALVQWTPERRTWMIGLSFEDANKVIAAPLPDHDKVIGVWFWGGALGHKVVIFEKKRVTYKQEIYPTGPGPALRLAVKRRGSATKYVEPKADPPQHWMVNTAGDLEGWGSEGVFITYPALNR